MAFELVAESYCILRHNNKNKLALITSLSKSTVNAYLNDDLEKDEAITPIKVPIENIVASLGPNPVVGSAYGVKIEPFYSQVDVEGWGTLSYYRKVPKKEKKLMFESLSRTFDVLDSKGLTAFVPVKLEIREHNGKHLGYYKHSKKEGVPSILCLKPPAFDLEPEDIDYIVYHEAGHGIWFTSVGSKFRAALVKLFERRVKCKSIKQKELDALLQAIYSYTGSIKDFIKDECPDSDQEVVKEAVKYMSKNYRLSVEDVDLLIHEDNIDNYWPTQQEISSVFPDISEYSMRSVAEFWAESFAHRLMKHKLPKDVKALMIETLEDVKNR